MEDALKTMEYNVSEFEAIVSTPEEETDIPFSIPEVNTSTEESIKINFSLKELNSTIEDSGKFFGEIFGKRDVILKEKWDVSENVQGKVILVNNSDVFVDCLVDIESKTFQHRAFPINLFKHIDGLAPDKMVVVKTRMKAGAIRIDVYSGVGIVNKEHFKQKANWDSLAGSGLDEKLTEW